MRVATFNIFSGRTPGQEPADADRLGAAIRLLDPDLLGLQEVDRNQPRSGLVDHTAAAAEAMGARHHRFVPALYGTPADPWAAAASEERPEAPAYGIAFLSRYDVSAWRVIRLPGAPVPVPHWSGGRLRPRWVVDEPRVAIVAEVATPRGRLDVVTTHLSFLRVWNRRQLHGLLAALGPLSRPTVLMGDLNMQPRPVQRVTGLEPLAAGRTFPAYAPVEQIDHILATPGVAPATGRVVELPVSDHRALVADL